MTAGLRLSYVERTQVKETNRVRARIRWRETQIAALTTELGELRDLLASMTAPAAPAPVDLDALTGTPQTPATQPDPDGRTTR